MFLFERSPASCEVDYGSEFRYRDPILDPADPAGGGVGSRASGRHAGGVEAGREKGTPVLAV